jgi:hypothetical protein
VEIDTGVHLNVSWAHVSRLTAHVLSSEKACPVTAARDSTCGDVFVYVLSDDALRLAVQHCDVHVPSDLQHIMYKARVLGVSFIHFDFNAPRYAWLPIYRETI